MFDKILKKNHKTYRNFEYKKGEIHLDFSLRVDIKEDLKAFLEILKQAVAEVEEEIAKK